VPISATRRGCEPKPCQEQGQLLRRALRLRPRATAGLVPPTSACGSSVTIPYIHQRFLPRPCDTPGARGQVEASKTVPLEVRPDVKHTRRGILSMARSDDPHSGGSSFSILLGTAPHLDMNYAIFGCAQGLLGKGLEAYKGLGQAGAQGFRASGRARVLRKRVRKGLGRAGAHAGARVRKGLGQAWSPGQAR
jgi:hypothetical protein